MTVFRGLTLVYTDGNPITGLGTNYAFQMFGRGYFLGIPVPAITMVLAFVILWVLLHKTPFDAEHTLSAATKKPRSFQASK